MSRNLGFRIAVPGACLSSAEPIGGPPASPAFDESSRSASSRSHVWGTCDEPLQGSSRRGGDITTEPIARPN